MVPPPDGFKPLEDGYHTNDADIGAYYRPEAGNMILTGSVDPACDPQEFVDPANGIQASAPGTDHCHFGLPSQTQDQSRQQLQRGWLKAYRPKAMGDFMILTRITCALLGRWRINEKKIK